MTTATPTGATLEAFRKELRGEVITPEDRSYEDARRIWNAMVDKRPALIARCLNPDDVAAAVRFARDQGLPLSVKGGGHGVAGKAIRENGLVIDLSLMNGLQVDPDRRTARVEGGVTWGSLDAATQDHGLATTGGVIPSTGIAGLTLGGGLGFLMRRFGLACDNLISAQVVTAGGEVLTASEEENPDLFWGLRGAGTNFGVVTTFEYQLHPVGPTILGGVIAYPVADARDVCRFYREVTATAPDELTVYLGFGTSPDGQPVVSYVLVYTGSLDEGERIVRPIQNFGHPMMNTVGPQPYVQMQRTFENAYPPGKLNYWKSSFLRELSDETVEIMIEGLAKTSSANSTLGFEHLGGAVARIGADATAFSERDAMYTVLFTAAWEDPADTERSVQWARDTWSAVQPQAMESVYVNYVDAGDENRVSSAYGENFARLAALKTKYDPNNVFSSNPNVAPVT
jgi:FAD/FMN-containing dehydrogenase